MNKEYYLKNGESLRLESELCVGCGACLEVCPHAVFVMEETIARKEGVGAGLAEGQAEGFGAASLAGAADIEPRPRKAARIRDREACMECGACARNCPASALSVKAGVGCAQAIIIGKLRGTAPDCGCGSSGCCG